MSDNNSTNSDLVANLSAIANLIHQDSSKVIVEQFHKIYQSVYQQLLELSDQSIFAPSEQITQSRSHFLNLLYQLDFDPLFGGLIVPCDYQQQKGHYQKPLLLNSLIADLLLQADRLLYTGELTQVAKLSIQYLHHQLQTSEQELLENQTYFAKQDCENLFSCTQLKSILASEELLLLGALIAKNDSSPEEVFLQENISVFYNRSLLNASTLVDMPFKQAQILEHAIQLKLKTAASEKQSLNHKLDEMILVNCLILQTLSSGIFYFNQTVDHPLEQSSWQTNVDRLMNALILLLDEEGLSAKEKIQIVIATVFYLQTKFSKTVLDKLLNVLKEFDFSQLVQEQVNESELNGKIIVQQLSLLASVVSTFNQSSCIDLVESDLQFSLADYLDEQWTIVILQKDSVQLDSQLIQIKSEFNPYRVVFCI